ncbi:hypothetical protein RvY_02390-3 [Ramazzottius varieornatus]|uniref:Uncharacterized protein n=1 Tax=Ramazzottius varieornatus TaxID=947166 RepID=A0A1D1UJI7_RAMVA|nr:hypothetical protein RvY_02390-3 [Ramazzottius varieornatus]
MWSNIYPTALGYTVRFGILREAMVGLNGLFVGLGEILGGVFLGLMGTRLNAFGKDGALLGGLVVHLLACYMAFINTPVSASRGMTEYPAFVGPSAYIALTTSLLFGLGDVIWCAQLMAYLGEVYRYEVVSVFTVYHSWMAIAAASLFGLSTVISLPYLLLIMVITAVISFAGFCVAEWEFLARQRFLLHLRQMQKKAEEGSQITLAD